jgi:hypothetical protein
MERFYVVLIIFSWHKNVVRRGLSALPEVELVDVIELDEYDCSEDDERGGDQEKDVTDVQKLLVFCSLSLHCRKSRLLRTGAKHRHDDLQVLVTLNN